MLPKDNPKRPGPGLAPVVDLVALLHVAGGGVLAGVGLAMRDWAFVAFGVGAMLMGLQLSMLATLARQLDYLCGTEEAKQQKAEVARLRADAQTPFDKGANR